MTGKTTILVFHRRDNVGTATDNIPQGANCTVKEPCSLKIEAAQPIPFGFKIALKDILAGEEVIKYGQVIGRSTTCIHSGELVHIHNIEGTRGRGDRESHQERRT